MNRTPTTISCLTKHEPETKSTSVTEKSFKVNEETTKDNDFDIPINTSIVGFNITSQESGKTTKISNSPSKENKNKKEKMINKNNDEKKQKSIVILGIVC